MESLASRLEYVEGEMFKISKDLTINKTEIVLLKEQLYKSERRLDSLEERMKTTPTTQEVLENGCGLTRNQADKMMGEISIFHQKVDSLEEQMKTTPTTQEVLENGCGLTRNQADKMMGEISSFHRKFGELSTLQEIFNALILKAQNKIQVELQVEQLAGQLVALSQAVTEFQSQLTAFEEIEQLKSQLVSMNEIVNGLQTQMTTLQERNTLLLEPALSETEDERHSTEMGKSLKIVTEDENELFEDEGKDDNGANLQTSLERSQETNSSTGGTNSCSSESDDSITKVKRLHEGNGPESCSPEIIALKRDFQKEMDLVRNCMIPINHDDYVYLSALEFVANVAEGPAWKHSHKIFSSFKKENDKIINDLQQRNRTENEAMVGYVDMCNGLKQKTQSLLSDLVFYYACEEKGAQGCTDCILAINKNSIMLLHSVTKKMTKEWPLEAVKKCYKEKASLKLEIQERDILTLYTFRVGLSGRISQLIKDLKSKVEF